MPFKFLLSFISLFFLGQVVAQQNHIVWNIESAPVSASSFKISYSGKIENGWHVYDAHAASELKGLRVNYNVEGISNRKLDFFTRYTTRQDVIFGEQLPVFSDSVVFTELLNFTGEVPSQLRVTILADVGRNDEFFPEEYKETIQLKKPATESGTDTSSPTQFLTGNLKVAEINLEKPLSSFEVDSAYATESNSSSLLTIFLLGFFGGLIALLTPCVFPMIPLTVSFFTKKSQTRQAGIRNASLYGFFILLIYILLSIPFHFIENLDPQILNNISTNVYLNLIFFVVFVVFALSFFGLFEITLPSSFSNKADSKSSAGNIVGIFFMALTLAIVSFSCTGPILGSLLAGSLSSNGGAWQLTSGMAGFGLALGLPFALFALFPNWLNSLPKSGGWLTTVKVVLGFIELGLALKFLSNADLVMHWGLLKREIFIGLWVVISALLTLYLFNIIRFPHDSPVKKISTTRKVFGVLAALFTMYLLPGVTNSKYANLGLISGFPPPLYYSVYAKESNCILNLTCTHSYEEGLKMAKEQNKLLLLDFTGYACVNCRKMEENVWVKPGVYDLMKEKYIIVSLYVDDKAKLPASQQFLHKSADGSEKEIETVGDKWAAFQTENFRNNSQPWYVILDTAQRLVSKPVGYVPNATEYAKWLQDGINTISAP